MSPRRTVDTLGRYALPALLAASALWYAVWPATGPVFATPGNARNLLASQAVLAMLTLGLVVPLVAGHLDLSVGNTAGAASVLTAATAAGGGLPVWGAVALGVAGGALVGLVNGALVTVLRVDSIVVTLGTSSVVFAVVNWYTGGQPVIVGVPASIVAFGSGTWLGVPLPFAALLVLAGIVGYTLGQTPYGRGLYAIGANRRAARLVGIRVGTSVLAAFTAAGALAGAAGVALLAYGGSGNPQVGPGFTLTAVAAAFVGATAFRPGQVNVAGALVAIYLIAVNVTGLQYAGATGYVEPLFSGAALVVAVGLSALLRRRRGPAPWAG
jgi:ribose transport system permease protein